MLHNYKMFFLFDTKLLIQEKLIPGSIQFIFLPGQILILGIHEDDLVGCDTLSNSGFLYNDSTDYLFR